MKEINDISLPRMNNGAHFTFVSNILARVESDSAVKSKAADQVSNFKAAVSAEDEALKISQKSLLTDDITKADSDRDALYAGYKKAVEAFLAMPIADMAQAAKVLAQHIKDYKINTADQLDKETGLLVNFITDLENKYSAQVAKLGLTAFVTNMKEANERVRTLTLQRTNEKMGVSVGALKTARTASDNAYRALVKMVNALALVFGEKDYAPFIDYVNTEITHYKREVLGQKSSAPSTSGSSSADSGSRDMLLTCNTIVQSFMLIITMPLSGISGGTQSVLGYNYGAGDTARIRLAEKHILKTALLFCTIMFVFAQWDVSAGIFVGLFTQNAAYRSMTVHFIHIYTLSVIPLAVQYALVDGLTGMSLVGASLPLSFFRKGIYIALAVFLPIRFGAPAMFYAEPLSDVAAAAVTTIVFVTVVPGLLRKREALLGKHIEK